MATTNCCINLFLQVSDGIDVSRGIVQVAMGAHYFTPRNGADISPDLDDILAAFPDWTVPISWAAVYKNWIVWLVGWRDWIVWLVNWRRAHLFLRALLMWLVIRLSDLFVHAYALVLLLVFLCTTAVCVAFCFLLYSIWLMLQLAIAILIPWPDLFSNACNNEWWNWKEVCVGKMPVYTLYRIR